MMNIYLHHWLVWTVWHWRHIDLPSCIYAPARFWHHLVVWWLLFCTCGHVSLTDSHCCSLLQSRAFICFSLVFNYTTCVRIRSNVGTGYELMKATSKYPISGLAVKIMDWEQQGVTWFQSLQHLAVFMHVHCTLLFSWNQHGHSKVCIVNLVTSVTYALLWH